MIASSARSPVAAASPSAPPEAERRRDRVFLGSCAGSLAFSLWFIWRASFTLAGKPAFVLFDDAMISMRYARNLANGDGLVWNPGGAHVEGFTNPLWTLWMAVLHLIPMGTFKQSALVMVSGALLLVAVLWVTRRLAEEILPGQRRVAQVSVVLAATFYPLIYWSLAGMEVGLLALLVGLLTLYAVRYVQRPDTWTRRDEIGLAVTGIAAIATRLDAVVPVALVIGFCAVWGATGRRARLTTLLRLGGPPLLGLVAMTLARLAYYGEVLPNTYYLKATGTAMGVRLSAGGRALAVSLLAHLAMLGLAALVGLLVERPARTPALWLLAGLGAAQAAYSVSVGGDAWEYMLMANRYLTATAVPMLVLAARGIVVLAGSPKLWLPRWCFALAGVAVAMVVLAPRIGRFNDLPSLFLQVEAEGQWGWYLGVAALLVALGLWARRAPQTTLLLLTVLVVVLTNLRGFDGWRRNPRTEMHDELAAQGWALRAASETDLVIGVWLAGADPYYSDRVVIDLFGKSDEHIAHLPARSGRFVPGHMKSDLAWSLETYHPDLVRLPPIMAGYDEVLDAHGYRIVADQLWARSRSSSLDKVNVWKILAFLDDEAQASEDGDGD